MKTDILAKRFEELVDQLQAVEGTKHAGDSAFYGTAEYIDNDAFINWKLKARNLLSMACGDQSEHYRGFVKLEEHTNYTTNYGIMRNLKAAFEAAREDYTGGYCNTVRNLVQAEVFSNELEQAEELLKAGYRTAAAVVAGVVLETTLRELCVQNGLTVGNLNKMNDDLAKAGQYNLGVKKRITALADIRNNAAHGHPEKFTDNDVKDMISYVQGFVADRL